LEALIRQLLHHQLFAELTPCEIRIYKEHSGNIEGTFREHLRNIQGTFREHSGIIQGNIQGNQHIFSELVV
jgi:hypothetical protein